MDSSTPKRASEERRRRRWKAFLTPIITLGAIVFSVAITLALIKSCTDRFPRAPVVQPKPLKPIPRL